MARVLLTGSTGLIGRATTTALTSAGHEVVATSRSEGTRVAHDAIRCNLLDRVAVSALVAEARASHLIHLAWHGGLADRWTSPANLDWMAATVHLVREFARLGGRRAVCVGSCAEYDWSEAILTESTALRPRTLYGATKAGTGLALCAAAPALDLSLAWARVFFVLGPGEPPGRLLGDLIGGLKAGKPVNCTDGLQERDFLHVDDLSQALVALLESSAMGAVNVASGHAIPVRDLIAAVADRIGRPDLVRLGAVARPSDDPSRLLANVARLREEVGFVPRHTLDSAVVAVLGAEPQS
jgi:nucleoside-diphosphate-sugar epimerase